MDRNTCLVGRTQQFPDRELVYWFERAIDDQEIVVRHPGTKHGDLVGRRQDFREYRDAVQARMNPIPGPATVENEQRHGDRLLAELDREWDIWGQQRDHGAAQS
jgi:hypothetical protein